MRGTWAEFNNATVPDSFERPRGVLRDERLRVVERRDERRHVISRSNVAEDCRRVTRESPPLRAFHRRPFEISAE